MKRRNLLALLSGGMMSLGGCTMIDRRGGSSPAGAAESPQTDTLRGTEPGRTETATPGTETPAQPTPTLNEFDRVVDAVDDVGCDPTGETPCGGAIERAAADGVAIRFPSGTYRFDHGYDFGDIDRLGFVGEGDVTFVPPEGFNGKLIEFSGDRALFKGIDIDVSAENTTAGLRLVPRSGFHVEDVEFVGRGNHPDEAVTNALSLAVTDSSKQGVVRGVVARHGSAIGHYKGGNGRVGIWIGQHHEGRIRIEDCRLEEFGNNGIYASRSLGTTEVIGGFYRNNNTSSVRLGGRGNVIKGVTIEVDTDEYTGPYTRTDSLYNTRGIVIEQGMYDKSGRVAIIDCEIRLRKADYCQGGIVVWSTGNGPRIERSRISTEVDWAPAIRGMPPKRRVNAIDRPLEIHSTTIKGGAVNGSAIEFRERPGSTIELTTIEQTGANRDGVQLIASNPCTFASTSITTTGYPILAVHPQTSTGECLVYVEGDTRFERTGPVPESLRSSELGFLDPWSRLTGNERRCIGKTILSELDAPKGIGIAEIRDGTVYWNHLSSVETAVDR